MNVAALKQNMEIKVKNIENKYKIKKNHQLQILDIKYEYSSDN